MKCKSCNNVVPDGSIYCNFCGEKLVKTKREKESGTSVPKARQKKSGTWFVDIMVKDERRTFSGKTAAEAQEQARAWKEGLIEAKKKSKDLPTLGEAIDRYLNVRKKSLSPATLRGYNIVRYHRFQSVIDRKIGDIKNWQEIIDAEAERLSPKTVKSAWGLISSVLREAGVEPPSVNLPKVPKRTRPWADHEQIKVFLAAVKGERCELAALLALHSLRLSEIYGLRARDIDLDRGFIRVERSMVPNEQNQLVLKDTMKTEGSRRVVPIMIPRLREILPDAMARAGDGPLIKYSQNATYKQLNRVCEAAGLPKISAHGLRHSFASLAEHLGMPEQETMRLGGWSDLTVMRQIYTHSSEYDQARADNMMRQFYADLGEITDKITDE